MNKIESRNQSIVILGDIVEGRLIPSTGAGLCFLLKIEPSCLISITKKWDKCKDKSGRYPVEGSEIGYRKKGKWENKRLKLRRELAIHILKHINEIQINEWWGK